MQGANDTNVDANQWLRTTLSRGFEYREDGGAGGSGDGAFVTYTGTDSFNQRVRGVLQFASDAKATTGLQTLGMDVFMDDNTAANALTFRVELYGWNGTNSPILALGGGTANDGTYNVTDLNGAATIFDTTIAATSVADAAWQNVTLGTIDLDTGYDFYAWRVGVFGATDTDVFSFENITVIPEPSAALLGGLGLLVLLSRRRLAA